MASFRNSPCICGSGLKYKKCCLYKEQGFIKVDTHWEKAVKIVQDQEKLLLEAPTYNLGSSISGKGNKGIPL